LSDNTTVSRTTPVSQELRELGLFSELGQPRPRCQSFFPAAQL